MATEAKPCIICKKRLYNVTDDATNQPSEGLYFRTHGQYGSTVFDPMDGSFLEICICDSCIDDAKREKLVLWGREAKPVIFDESVVGFCATPDRPMMDWIDQTSAFEDPEPANDILHIDEDVLENPENFPEIKWNVPPEDLLKMERRHP